MDGVQADATPHGRSRFLERAGRRLVRLLLLGVVSAAAVMVWRLGTRAGTQKTLPVPGDEHRFTVEVLNSTSVNGLARALTRRLRSEGIDVVFIDNFLGEPLDSTQIVIRSGDSAAAYTVQAALGTGQILDDRDASRLVDVSVVLGLDAHALLSRQP